jgi:hypothetical protein
MKTGGIAAVFPRRSATRVRCSLTGRGQLIWSILRLLLAVIHPRRCGWMQVRLTFLALFKTVETSCINTFPMDVQIHARNSVDEPLPLRLIACF